MNEAPLSVSLNEVETMSAKAARGAGLPWGVADDLGRAACWMAERGVDWSRLLLLLLDGGEAGWLRSVMRVADLATCAAPDSAWAIESCEPIWALSLLSGAIRGSANQLEIRWAGGEAYLGDSGGGSAALPIRSLAELRAQALAVRLLETPRKLTHGLDPAGRRGTVSADNWHRLGAYAAKTYVAASTRSRAGAGGGRVDDD